MGEENGYTSGISATLKAAEGFDAPWVVIHAKDAAEMAQHLTDLYEGPVLNMVAQLQQIFQGKFEQKPRYQSGNRGGGGGSRGGSNARSAPAATATSTAPATTAAGPPPAFVANQQAQPADWGHQQAVNTAQQNFGGQVEAPAAPNEVNACRNCNGQTQYHPPGTNRSGRGYGPSYRCPQQGHGSWWFSDRDNVWNWVEGRR